MLCLTDDTSEMGGTFDIFCGLLPSMMDGMGMDPTASGGAVTMFVPTDEAFMRMYALLGTVGKGVEDGTLTEILMYHVHAGGMIMSHDLVCGGLLDMMAAGSSRTRCETFNDGSGQAYIIQKGGGNRKNGVEPIVTSPDHMTCDGSVVHVVDQVLLPNFIDEVVPVPSN